jgi:sporulenol synthase
MVFALQALGYPSYHPRIVRAVMGLKDMVYRRKAFVHQQFFTSTVWDTSLSLQALTAAGVPSTHHAMIRGATYLVSRQQHLVSDWHYRTPDVAPGGWGFSDVNTLYPDVDDTVAAVKALYPFRRIYRSQWKRGVKWTLAMQNDDGGWSAFDRNSNKMLLELLLGEEALDPSTPDITGRVLETLGYAGISATASINRGVRWLLNQQRSDGSWLGRWGIAFIYGTSTAIQGLRASGIPTHHPSIQKALSWLENVQHADGGYGESCQSDERQEYVPRKQSKASQTAWALMGMISASGRITPKIEHAAQYLVETARPHGGWRETYPTGTGIAGQAYIRYHSYPYVWPLLALCAYRKYITSG